jgi:cytoskeletal protein CcmA (bactofilin family)
MFLTLTAAIAASRLNRDERGAALVAVIGVMAVGMLLTTLILASLSNGIGFTSSARAGTQSQAAAEAGIAVARAGVMKGTCVARGGVYESVSGTTPKYRVAVENRATNGTWQTGCPNTGSAQIRFKSVGTAAALATSGQSGNDKSTVESIFSIPVTDTTITGSGPAVFAYSSTGFGGSGTLVSINGSEPDVIIKTGNVSCTGASQGGVDWVIDGGTLAVGGSCNITGNVWSTGRTSLSGNVEVGGNIIADGVTVSSSSVGGSIWSTADVDINPVSTIEGNVTGQSVDSKSSTIKGSAHIYQGATLKQSTVQGNLTSKTRDVQGGSVGSYTTIPAGPGPSPYLTPEKPIVPAWFDFTYKPNDWTGFTKATLPTGTCDYSSFVSAITTFGSAPGVIDARNCSNPVSLSGWQTLSVQNDLAIIAKAYDFGGSGKIQGPASNDKRLWIMTEDLKPNLIPTCASGSFFKISGTFDFDRLSTMIYTPCAVDVSSNTSIEGQIFAGSTSLGGGSTLGYVAVGVPGYNLDTGTSTTNSNANAPWVLRSTRNLPNGG